MKRTFMIAVFVGGSLLLSILYSCVKESLANEEPAAQQVNNKGVSASYVDSGCKVCSENKSVTLTPDNFFPINVYGVETLAKRGRATISDPEVQVYKKLNVIVKNTNGWEVALPLFHMAADGSYESLSYDYGSSVLMLHYVRFNKATGIFTYKPVNNLAVKYSVTMLN